MATYSNVPAVSGAVSASGNSGTIYTCPANSYAIINATVTSDFSNNNQMTVATRVVAYADGTGAAAIHSASGVSCATATVFSFGPIYVGPGQAVAVNGGATWDISGVCLTNQA